MAKLHLVPNQLNKSKIVFAAEKASLLQLLNSFQVQIEHIGSTALHQSLTKPILDILLVAQTPKDQTTIATLLVNFGYSQGELNRKQTKLFFYKDIHDSSTRFIESIHLHLAYKNTPNRHDLVSIPIRDYLLNHPKEVKAYNAQKRRLADAGNYDRRFYALHKEPYIKKLIDKVTQ